MSSATESPFLIVAIDGGAASGKSSTARALSQRFGLLHVDTGSHYRGLTAEMLRQGVTSDDPAALRAALGKLRLETRVADHEATIVINGRDVGAEIRSREVNDAVSHYAAIPEVRAALLAYQRSQTGIARQHGYRGLVMEGRDIGSVIFPGADLRFFLHADLTERARRRAGQGQQDQITERDRLDSQRQAAPLTCAPGAIVIDSTHLTLAQVVERMAAPIAQKLSAA